MKNSKYGLYFILIITITITFISCQKTVSVEDEREYYSGYQDAEKIAKQDALEHACTGTIENPSSSVWFQKKKYLAELKKTRSEKYIKGFLWGYESSFIGHMRTYCGDTFYYRHIL